MLTLILVVLIVVLTSTLCLAYFELVGGCVGGSSMVPGCLGIMLLVLIAIVVIGALTGKIGFWTT